MKTAYNYRESTRKFLIYCLRAFLAAEGEPLLSLPIEAEVDWNFLFQLASWHKVLPLLYRSLQGAGMQAAPEPVLSRLKAYVRSALCHSLFLTGELLRLLKRFEAQGIPAIPINALAVYNGRLYTGGQDGSVQVGMTGE